MTGIGFYNNRLRIPGNATAKFHCRHLALEVFRLCWLTSGFFFTMVLFPITQHYTNPNPNARRVYFILLFFCPVYSSSCRRFTNWFFRFTQATVCHALWSRCRWNPFLGISIGVTCASSFWAWLIFLCSDGATAEEVPDAEIAGSCPCTSVRVGLHSYLAQYRFYTEIVVRTGFLEYTAPSLADPSSPLWLHLAISYLFLFDSVRCKSINADLVPEVNLFSHFQVPSYH